MNGGNGTARPLGLLIAALGGDGGGVLCNWIVTAVAERGFPVQSTSIPGVAQRTGATTYYVEIWPEPWSDLGGRQPVLSLTASPGDVDMVVASELIEAGRTILQGFVTPDRTCLVTSTHRVFTTAEKMAMGDGRHDSEAVLKTAVARSQRLLAFDLQDVAREAGAPLSAVLLGALAGACLLPLDDEDFRHAIEGEGKAVAVNLRGFEAGLATVLAGGKGGVQADAAAPALAGPVDNLVRGAQAALPSAVHETLGHAIPRLVDYQDTAYASAYLDRLSTLKDLPPDVFEETARQLAVRMSYEDVIRVAQAKLRRARFQRIHEEAGGEADDPVYVTDFFKPGVSEIADLLPPRWAKRLLARADKDPYLARWHRGMAVRTDTFGGAFRLWLLAQLRRWRRKTYRYHNEQAAIDAWLGDVTSAAEKDPALALEIARSARLIKGYGDTHRRGVGNFERLRETILRPVLDEHASAEGAAARMAAAREAALADPDGKILDTVLTDSQ